MIIKRYIANTTQEAINQVKIDLGSDAVILNTRRIRKKGLAGWFSKSLIEVTAAIDNTIITSKPQKNNVKTKTSQPIVQDTPYINSSSTHIEKKLDAMGDMMQRLISKFPQESDSAKPKDPYKDQPYYEALMRNEVRQEYALEIMDRANELHKNYNMEFSKCFEKVILNCLGEAPEPVDVSIGHRKIILFVGPTGVGKTTTLAKLAAHFTIEHGKKVGFITADTYRIAAVDQLRIYAEILEIPISIIYSPSEISGALKEHQDKDIVLIDTAGRSIRDQNHEGEIKEIIALGNIDEVYLVISGNTSPQGCINIINSYKFLTKYKLIFTKIDEITTYGTILNCCLMSKSPLSYITTGQNVPDDIEIADTNRIKDLLIGNVVI